VRCPTCAKVNDASALACSLCGASLATPGREAPKRAANDKAERDHGAPSSRPTPPAFDRKVPTLQGVHAPTPAPAPALAPALAARAAGKTRTVLGVATPGPGNQRPAAAPAAPPAEAPTARSSDVVPHSPRAVLGELLRRHGEEIMTDPRHCSSLLAADYHRQVSYLIAALEERIPQRLVVESSAAPVEIVVLALAGELGRRRELPPQSALYAVESWAIALGLLAPPLGEGPGA
jgi:hypothetical protein